MGSGLCRRTRGDGRPRAKGVNGFYQKIVFNYAKQFKRYSDKHPKDGEKNTKHNKSKKPKPTISGPFPVDPERLQGDKWRFVILTRLDTEQPPERPPRTKRHGNRQPWPETTFGRWGSARRRSFGRGSRGRPPRPIRRRAAAAAAAATAATDDSSKRLSAPQLLELMLRVYTLRHPVGRSLPPPPPPPPRAEVQRTDEPSLEESCSRPARAPADSVDRASRAHKAVKKSKPWFLWLGVVGLPPVSAGIGRSNGFFQSVDRVKVMANNLLL